MLHLTRRWCAECYQECASENIPCWDPLYWASRAVTVCTVHRTPLLEICPWCSSRQPFLPKLPFLDRCDSCGGSLAVVPDAVEEGRCRKGSHQLWIALDCVDLIAAMQQFGPARYRTLQDNLDHLLMTQAGGEIGFLATALGLSRASIHNWFFGESRPCFLPFAEFCARTRIPMRSMLFSETPPITHPAHWRPGPMVEFVNRGGNVSEDKREKITEAFVRLLRRPQREWISVRQFAADQRVTVSYLRRSFPAPCKVLADATRQRTREGAAARTETRRLYLEEARAALAAAGRFPSQRALRLSGMVRPSDVRREASARR